jgi:hypothetical protein
MDFLDSLSDDEYDEYMNYRFEQAELVDHIEMCKLAEQDIYCKVCNEM